MSAQPVQLLVRKILERPLGHRWTLQGLGMLRLYLSDEVRLHVWDSARMFPGASSVHTHPWDFSSYVVSGRLTNRIFAEQPACGLTATHRGMTIKCGDGAHSVGPPFAAFLFEQSIRIYSDGQMYAQAAEQIHETETTPGTVTIVTRTFRGDRDHARVFWPVGSEFGSAEPRPVTNLEILASCGAALERWLR